MICVQFLSALAPVVRISKAKNAVLEILAVHFGAPTDCANIGVTKRTQLRSLSARSLRSLNFWKKFRPLPQNSPHKTLAVSTCHLTWFGDPGLMGKRNGKRPVPDVLRGNVPPQQSSGLPTGKSTGRQVL